MVEDELEEMFAAGNDVFEEECNDQAHDDEEQMEGLQDVSSQALAVFSDVEQALSQLHSETSGQEQDRRTSGEEASRTHERHSVDAPELGAPHLVHDYQQTVLGDGFHYMDRPKVPMRHPFKKAYFMALTAA